MSQPPLKVLIFALGEYGNFNPSIAAASHQLMSGGEGGIEVSVSSFDEGHDNGSGPRARVSQLNMAITAQSQRLPLRRPCR